MKKFPLAFVLLVVACVEKKSFAPEKLTHCMIYEIRRAEPVYLRQIEEGDVAYYGLILQSAPDAKVLKYLQEKSRDHLWEYQWDYGVTAADSALVLEGLLAAGIHSELLRPSAEKLSLEYFEPRSGGFRTVLNARAVYWEGAHVVTTAHIAWILYQIDSKKYQLQIRSAMKFVEEMQQSDGSWKADWFPSRNISLYYSTRLLAISPERYSSQLAKAKLFLQKTMQPEGSWSGSIIETAAALLALRTLGDSEREITAATSWLKLQIQRPIQGEPVLFYWFERSKDAPKEFFHCSDKGQITQAWARLALKP